MHHRVPAAGKAGLSQLSKPIGLGCWLHNRMLLRGLFRCTTPTHVLLDLRHDMTVSRDSNNDKSNGALRLSLDLQSRHPRHSLLFVPTTDR